MTGPVEEQLATQAYNRRNAAYRAWSERDTDLYPSRPARKVVPLLLGGHVVKVRREPDASHEQIVAHVVRDAIAATFRFLLSQVALYGHF